MRITIDIEEKELLAGLLESVIKTDKTVIKHLLRSMVKEAVLCINHKTAKLIAEKYVEIEEEINYQASQKTS
jgi:hypothetical protein